MHTVGTAALTISFYLDPPPFWRKKGEEGNYAALYYFTRKGI